jgi:hypothetical protein
MSLLVNDRSKPGESWHVFTNDDLDLLELMCLQLRSTMRRYLPYALLDYLSTNAPPTTSLSTSSSSSSTTTATPSATSGETGVRLRSFIDTYSSEPTLLKTRSMSEASRGRGLSFQWPIDSGKRFNVEQLASPTFNVWEYSDNDLVTLTWRIFQVQTLTYLKSFVIVNHTDNMMVSGYGFCGRVSYTTSSITKLCISSL